MTRPTTPLGLTVLVILGVVLSTSGIVLHLALPARYEHVEIIPIVVGFAIALYGSFWMDPERAKQATTGVTHAGADVVHSVVELRTGDRKTDPVVRVEKTTPADDPEATPDVKVTVTQQGGSPAALTPTPTTTHPLDEMDVPPRDAPDGGR